MQDADSATSLPHNSLSNRQLLHLATKHQHAADTHAALPVPKPQACGSTEADPQPHTYHSGEGTDSAD